MSLRNAVHLAAFAFRALQECQGRQHFREHKGVEVDDEVEDDEGKICDATATKIANFAEQKLAEDHAEDAEADEHHGESIHVDIASEIAGFALKTLKESNALGTAENEHNDDEEEYKHIAAHTAARIAVVAKRLLRGLDMEQLHLHVEEVEHMTAEDIEEHEREAKEHTYHSSELAAHAEAVRQKRLEEAAQLEEKKAAQASAHAAMTEEERAAHAARETEEERDLREREERQRARLEEVARRRAYNTAQREKRDAEKKAKADERQALFDEFKAALDAGKLPPGWSSSVSRGGRWVFRNTHTNAVQYTLPTVDGNPDTMVLPEGWKHGEKGDFVNTLTGQRQKKIPDTPALSFEEQELAEKARKAHAKQELAERREARKAARQARPCLVLCSAHS